MAPKTDYAANQPNRPCHACQVAKSSANRTSDRVVRYGSKMKRAVPATGIVRSDATIATPAHRPSGSGKRSLLQFQHASNVRKIDARYQRNTAQSKGM